MKWLLAWLLLTTSAMAQQPAQYILTLTPEQLNLIGKALGKLPYEDAWQIIGVIQQQAVKQQQEAAKPPPPPPPAPEQPK
jgi:hypothetical protein